MYLQNLEFLQVEELCHTGEYVSTGDTVLDAWFRHDLSVGNFIEFYGSSATGKTQFALQLSMMTTLPPALGGLDARVLYLCTQESFPFKRFFQLLDHKIPKSMLQEASISEYGERVLVHHIGDLLTQDHFITVQLPAFFEALSVARWQDSDEEIENNLKLPVKLIVIDSIANHVRSETHEGSMIASMNVAWASQLKELALQYNLLVLSLNQVTQKPSTEEGLGGLYPSLGLSWSYGLHARFYLQRSDPMSTGLIRRKIRRIFSDLSLEDTSSFPEEDLLFSIDATGIITDHGTSA